MDKLPSMKVTRFGAGVFTIADFLSPDECREFIATSEGIGFEPAHISTDAGEMLLQEARNNDRIIHDNVNLAEFLYQRASPHLPEIDGWTPCGFNERLRYYRYGEQKYFEWHQDGTFRRSAHEESFLTFMIYLNDDYAGGRTEFRWESIEPTSGMALVFPHRLHHRGAAVTAGTKYVLRTDVIATRATSGESCQFEKTIVGRWNN